MALDVGGVFADAGLRVRDEGFRRFDRLMDGASRRARDDIRAHADLDVDDRGFRRYNNNLDRMDHSARSAEKSHGRLYGAVGSAGTRFAAVATGAGAAAAAVLYAGKTVVDYANDVNESLTKNQQLFGNHAKRIDAWSKSTATSIGISRKEALSAAGDYGSLFETIGLGDKPAANMSIRLTELAGDLASFNNAAPEEAMEALRSGLIGEAEPMRRFGALLSETRVQQEAWSSGIAENGTALTEQQKVQARYQLILKDTNAAQGDFHRTSGGLANQLRVLRANAIDLGTKIGGFLLPPVLSATKFLNSLFGSTDKAGKGAQTFGDRIRSIGGPIGKFLSTVREEAGKLGRGIAREFQGVSDDLRRIGHGLRDIGEFLLAGLRRSLPGVRKVLVGLAQVVRGFVEIIAGILSLDFGKAWDGVKDVFGGAFKVLLGTIRGVTGPFREGFARIGRAMSRPLGAAFDWIEQAFKDFLDTLLGGVSSLLDIVEKLPGAFGWLPGVGGKFKGLADDIEDTRNSIDRYRESLRKTDDEHERGDPVIRRRRRRVRELRDELGDLRLGTNAYREKAADLRRAEDKLSDAQRDRRSAARVAGRAIMRLKDNTSELGETESDVFTYTQEGVNRLLQEFGAKRIDMSVRRFRSHQRGPGFSTNATGGMYQFGAPGDAGPDSMFGSIGGFNVAVAPGEVAAVLTRHHQRALDNVFAPVGGFAGFIAGMNTPHAAGYQGGGIVPIPGQPGESISRGILGDVVNMIRAYRLKITDGYAPTGHAAGGEHPLGLAIDAVPGPGGSWGLIGKGMADSGYPNPPNPPFRWLGWTNEPGHGPGNHGHWSWLHGRSGFRGAGLDPDPPHLRVSGGTRMMNRLAQGTANRLYRPADRYLDRQAAATMPTIGGVLSGDAAANRRLGMSLASRFGWRGSQFRALDALWQGESGWDALATNPSSGAFGIPQALPPGKMGARAVAGDARAQILWGLRYIRDRYGSPASAYGSWLSRSPHWYGRGGVLSFQKGGLVSGAGKLTRKGRRRLERWSGVADDQADRIEDIGQRYDLASRRFDFTEEEFVNEGDENTPPSLNMKAIEHRSRELGKLIRFRENQVSAYKRMVRYLKRVEHVYNMLVRKIETIMRGIRKRLSKLPKGREGRRKRDSLQDRLKTYRKRLGVAEENRDEAVDRRQEAGFELQSTELDVDELQHELDPLTKSLAGQPGGVELPDWSAPELGGDIGAGATDVDAQARADQLAAQLAASQEALAGARAGFSQLLSPGDIGAGGPTALATATNPYSYGGAGNTGGAYSIDESGQLVGSGGAVVIVNSQSLIPGGPDEYRKVGEAVTVGLGYQPYQIATIERQG